MASHDEYASAKARGQRRRRREPFALKAHFDIGWQRIVVELDTGLVIAFPPSMVEGLQEARPRDLREIEISPSGFGLHFLRLDADVYLPGLLAGTLREHGRKGAQARTLKDLLLTDEGRGEMKLLPRGRHPRRRRRLSIDDF